MSNAEPHPAMSRNQPSRHCPIRLRELARCSRGNIANGSCSASTTWLKHNQVVDVIGPADANKDSRGDDGQRTGDEPPQPRLDPPVHEAFHHHLAGHGADNGGALPAGQQCDGEKHARGRGTHQRCQRQVGRLDPIRRIIELDHLSAGDRDTGLAVKDNRGQHQNGGVDQEGHRQVGD